MIDISVVILNYNTRKLTLDCLTSVFKSPTNLNIKVWVVDNRSTDDSIEKIKEKFSNVTIIENKENLGFSKGINIALKRAHQESRYCLLLNSDTVVSKRMFDLLFSFAKQNKFNIVSCKLESIDGSLQPNTGRLPYFWPVFVWLSGLDDITKKFLWLPSYQERNKKGYIKDGEVGWVSGTAMLINSQVIGKIGFLDDNIFMYGEDVEYCLRAKKASFRVGWTKSCKVIHLGGASSDSPKLKQWLGEFKGLLYIYKKHFGPIPALLLKTLMYFFIFLRSVVYFTLGNSSYGKTYAKILTSL